MCFLPPGIKLFLSPTIQVVAESHESMQEGLRLVSTNTSLIFHLAHFYAGGATQGHLINVSEPRVHHLNRLNFGTLSSPPLLPDCPMKTAVCCLFVAREFDQPVGGSDMHIWVMSGLLFVCDIGSNESAI